MRSFGGDSSDLAAPCSLQHAHNVSAVLISKPGTIPLATTLLILNAVVQKRATARRRVATADELEVGRILAIVSLLGQRIGK